MKRTILIALLAGLALEGQTPARFSATTGDVVLSGAATTLTIQQPSVASGNAKQVTLEQAVVYCSVPCNITQTINGTGATTTAGSAAAIPPFVAPGAGALIYTASNVSGGTGVGGILHLSAGQTATICLNTACGALVSVAMGNSGTNTNYSFTTSAITGTANFTVYWTEK